MVKLPAPDVILAKLSKMSKRERIVLFGAIFVLSAAFVDRVIVHSLTEKINGLDKQIKERETQIRKDLSIMAREKTIQLQQVNYKSYMGARDSENEEFTVFLKELENIASKSKIYLVDMKPTGTKQSGESKKYMVNLNCEGEMEPLVEFMYNIENANKLMTVEKYQIDPKSKDSDSAKCSLLISKLVIP